MSRRYEVVVSRTERIVFLVTADSPEDAANRALSDGDEVASRTTDLTTISVKEET